MVAVSRDGRWRSIRRNSSPAESVEPGKEDAAVREETCEVVAEPIGAAPVLVHALSGFLEAGSARRIAVTHLLENLEHRTIASYPMDHVYDYRARRPRMVFESDHFSAVTLPELLLSEVTDARGTHFLLLHGPEPDFGWQTFTRSLLGLVDRFEVPLTVGVNAIPWASPHTRPLGVTAHATDPDLISGRRSWLVGALEIPGHLSGLLELSLGEAGKPALGFAVHVPHYLVNGEYPRASLTMLEEVAAVAGLSLPLEALRTAADESDQAVDAQVRENPENAEAIAMLEQQYDAMVVQHGGGSGVGGVGPIPSGDEIAAQLEDFLRELDDKPGSD
jgi:hypothetical protein